MFTLPLILGGKNVFVLFVYYLAAFISLLLSNMISLNEASLSVFNLVSGGFSKAENCANLSLTITKPQAVEE